MQLPVGTRRRRRPRAKGQEETRRKRYASKSTTAHLPAIVSCRVGRDCPPATALGPACLQTRLGLWLRPQQRLHLQRLRPSSRRGPRRGLTCSRVSLVFSRVSTPSHPVASHLIASHCVAWPSHQHPVTSSSPSRPGLTETQPPADGLLVTKGTRTWTQARQSPRTRIQPFAEARIAPEQDPGPFQSHLASIYLPA